MLLPRGFANSPLDRCSEFLNTIPSKLDVFHNDVFRLGIIYFFLHRQSDITVFSTTQQFDSWINSYEDVEILPKLQDLRAPNGVVRRISGRPIKYLMVGMEYDDAIEVTELIACLGTSSTLTVLTLMRNLDHDETAECIRIISSHAPLLTQLCLLTRDEDLVRDRSDSHG